MLWVLVGGFFAFCFPVLFCFVVLVPTRAKQASAALYTPSPLWTFCFDAGSQEVGQPGVNSLRMPWRLELVILLPQPSLQLG